MSQLRVRQCAQRLAVSERTVRNYITAGKLPAAKLPGGDYRIPEWAIEAILVRINDKPSVSA